MATILPVKTIGQNRTGTVLWEAITVGDTGGGVEIGAVENVTVQVFGTFPTSGRIDIEGSNDGGTTWAPVGDFWTGAAIQFTAAGLQALGEFPHLIRANLGAGSGGVDLDVWLAFKYKN